MFDQVTEPAESYWAKLGFEIPKGVGYVPVLLKSSFTVD
jgi:hypothetical protein